MTKHLLAISIGPVQDFIAAARRTADLYAGSQLLVEIAKTIARTIQSNGGKLIFPAVVTRNGKAEISDGPNKIVAEIINDKRADVVDECRKAALNTLKDAWTNAKKSLQNRGLDEILADHQINSFLEFYAAWLPWDGDPGRYEKVRLRLDRLLAGRKALRDFQQPKKDKETKAGRPKSPLDPSRDCALDITGTQPVPLECQTDPLWLKKRETLDALSLLKRVRGDAQFKNVPSTSFMAAQAILPAVKNLAEQPNQEKLKEALTGLENLVRDTPAGIDMGDLMFPNRLQEEIESLEEAQAKKPEKRRDEVLQLLKNREIDKWRKQILEAAKSLGYKGSEYPPYYAILVADGDKMGALIGELKYIEKHRKFSAALSSFAEEAEKIVRSHSGHLVYSGGDDVLALLPVNRALDCAQRLAEQFKISLEKDNEVYEVLNIMRSESKKGGTLSVGIAIVHHMDPLLVSLEHARAAEKEAKKEKPALAVALHTRAGEPMIVRELWENGPTVTELKNWIKAFRGELARGFPYELRALAREFKGLGLPQQRLINEAIRILKRKKGAIEGDETKEPLKSWIAAIQKIKTPDEMEELAKKLVIARFLSSYEVKQ
jgi:CRISPR-associated protein Cmr2